MIEEDYVSVETAKLLKKKGFDEEVKSYYSYDSEFKIYDFQEDDRWDTPNDWGEYYLSAPTLQMVRKWLREKHHLHIEIRITNHTMSDMVNVIKYYWVMCDTETGRWCDESTVYNVRAFDKSEEAEEDAIRHALEKID